MKRSSSFLVLGIFIGALLLGALAQTGILPLTEENIKTAIRTKTKQAFVDINIKAFDLGFAAAAQSV